MATIVVDLDGTIIDSTRRHHLLLKKILRDNGIPTTFDSQDYLSYKRDGHNNYDFLTKRLNLEPQLAEHIQKEWINNIESKELIASDRLYPDATRFLNEIKNLGYRIVFLTARQNQKNLRQELNKLKLATFPDQVIVVRNDKTDAFQKIPGSDKIMVGDTEVDFKAAAKSKTISYILNRGFRSHYFLCRLGINKTYNDLDDIISQIRDTYH